MSISEKLAELCGYRRTNYSYTDITGCQCSGVGFQKGSELIEYSDWNPTQDLNQLKMCYEALSEEELIRFAELTIYAPFDAWVTQTELVAQAILKAKGVS